MIDKMLNETKVIRDNVHGNIVINYQIIWDLINTDVFQRLRRIHQLGGTFMVYPSAEHSRFTHSLGVYHIVNRFINEVTNLKDVLSSGDIIALLCSGLLHDIGHGPYSHAFEDVFNTNHEVMSTRIILENTSITKVLDKYSLTLKNEITSIINKTHHNKLLVQIISSQVDADRMDYLLRDSLNCGVSYGKFDLDRLIRSMIVIDNKLVFKESGVHALENYIFSRYHMYWQVYLHPTANSYEIILNKILSRIKFLNSDNYQFNCDISLLLPFLKEGMLIEDYLKLDEGILSYYFSKLISEKDVILSNLCNCFINRILFKHRDIDNRDDGLKLIKDTEKDDAKQEYYFEIHETKSSLYKYYGDINSQSINIVTKNNTLKELYEVSNLVNAIVKSAQDKKEVKLFYHQVYMSDLYGSE